MTQELSQYIRNSKAVVSTDFNAYQAAKLRKQSGDKITTLEARINMLEECVRRLETTVKEMSKT